MSSDGRLTEAMPDSSKTNSNGRANAAQMKQKHKSALLTMKAKGLWNGSFNGRESTLQQLSPQATLYWTKCARACNNAFVISLLTHMRSCFQLLKLPKPRRHNCLLGTPSPESQRLSAYRRHAIEVAGSTQPQSCQCRPREPVPIVLPLLMAFGSGPFGPKNYRSSSPRNASRS